MLFNLKRINGQAIKTSGSEVISPTPSLRGKLTVCQKSVRTLPAANKGLESKVDDVKGKLHDFAKDECKKLKRYLLGFENKDINKSREIESLKTKKKIFKLDIRSRSKASSR